MEDSENNPFIITGAQENNQMTVKQTYFDLKNPMEWDIIKFHHFFIEKNKDRPEKLNYMKAADKLIKNLRDIVSTSANANTIRKALSLQKKAKVVAISTVSWFGSLQLRGDSA
ncbi:6805_t:CDS:2 [Funneliformis geosporum]|nr:6805_t:CDS:2 [Funneliformis geosporum]